MLLEKVVSACSPIILAHHTTDTSSTMTLEPFVTYVMIGVLHCAAEKMLVAELSRRPWYKSPAWRSASVVHIVPLRHTMPKVPRL
jgi:hypothetical protein